MIRQLGVLDGGHAVAMWHLRLQGPGDGVSLPRLVEVGKRRGGKVEVRRVMDGVRMQVWEDEVRIYGVPKVWVKVISAEAMLALLGRVGPRG